MKNIANKHTFPVSTMILLAIFILSGCLPDSQETQFRTSVQVGLELESIGADDVITGGDDEINITQIRILHGASFFRTGEDSLFLRRNPENPQVESFNTQTPNPLALAAGNLAEGSYQLLHIKFPRAPEGSSGLPEFTDDGRYSLIVQGSYNGDVFTYRSPTDFEKVRTFMPELDVPEFDGSFIFLVSADVADWFVADDGSLLDPSNTDNSSTIDENIQSSLQISILEGNETEL